LKGERFCSALHIDSLACDQLSLSGDSVQGFLSRLASGPFPESFGHLMVTERKVAMTYSSFVRVEGSERLFYEEVGLDYTKLVVARRKEKRQALTIGLATGGTMEGLYQFLAKDGSLVDVFREAQFVGLDEYCGLEPGHPQSYWYYYQSKFFEPMGLDISRLLLPGQDNVDRFDELVEGFGGIDVQLLGVGENGHAAFNEPPADLMGRTRKVLLADSTRAANARYFDSLDDVPTNAFTMGMKSINNAKHLVLLARGERKRNAVRFMLDGQPSPDWPASLLLGHPSLRIYHDGLDEPPPII
jgi:glucosamine-6-phosphate deaminase